MTRVVYCKFTVICIADLTNILAHWLGKPLTECTCFHPHQIFWLSCHQMPLTNVCCQNSSLTKQVFKKQNITKYCSWEWSQINISFLWPIFCKGSLALYIIVGDQTYIIDSSFMCRTSDFTNKCPSFAFIQIHLKEMQSTFLSLKL